MQVGKYQVVHHIATGGMGAVYRATDAESGCDIALKILSPEMASRPGVIERFKREAAAAAKMSHENIVQLFEWGEVNGLYYLALEFVDGIDLQEYVARKGKLRPEIARNMILQAARALDHVHQQGIVHRDIKPSNFLVMKRERKPIIKLIDLGLAREIDNEQFRITRANHTLGTIDYMSPEQARDSGMADIRSDIYSLGCTFYHMLAGQPPFAEGGLAERLYKHSEVEPPDILKFNPEMPPGLVYILGKMLAKKPVQRYQTPADLIKDLENSETMRGPIKTEFLEDLAYEGNGGKSSPPRRSDPAVRGRGSDAAVRRSVKKAEPEEEEEDLEDSGDDWPDEPPPKKLEINWAWVGLAGAAIFLAVVAVTLYFGLRDQPKPAAARVEDSADTVAPIASTVAPPSVAPPTLLATPKKETNTDKDALAKIPEKKEQVATATRVVPARPPEAERGPPRLYRPAAPIDAVALRRQLETAWPEAPSSAGGQRLKVSRGGSTGDPTVFGSLAKACAAAMGSEAIIEIEDNGPLFEDALSVQGRHLTIRGGAGFHPMLAFDILPGKTVKADAWISLADGDLTLENLEIVVKYPESSPAAPTAVAEVANGSFRARDCTFSIAGKARAPVAAVRLRGSPTGNPLRCRLDRCYLRGGDMIALDLQAAADVLLNGCLLVGGDPSLLEVAGHHAPALTTLRVVRSTLAANQTILHLRPAGAGDLEPALHWFGWDSLLTRPGEQGGEMVVVDGDARTSGLDWQAVNCLYSGWKTLLSSSQDMKLEPSRWLERWHRAEGDVARAGSWPTVAQIHPSEVGAQEYRTDGTPVFYPATSGSGGLGCDVTALPPTRDNWPMLTYDRAAPPPLDVPAAPSGNAGFGDALYMKQVDLAKDDLGGYIENLGRAHEIGPRLMLRVVGEGRNGSKPIRLKGTDLTLYLENRTKKSAPLVLVPGGTREPDKAFIDIEGGSLRLIGGGIRYPDASVVGAPAYLVRVRDGQLTMSGTHLLGPVGTPPATFRSLVRLEATPQSSRDDSSRLWVVHNSVLASEGNCLDAAGSDAQLYVRNCAIVAGGAALHLAPGAAARGRPNLQCFLEHNTFAVKDAAIGLDDAPAPLPDPVIVQSRSNAYLAPFSDGQGRAGLLRYEDHALHHGLLVWHGEGDAFDKRLTFAALPAHAAVAEQPHTLWTSLWGSGGDHGAILDASFFPRTIELAKTADPEKPHLEALALPTRPRSKPLAGADFTELGIRRTKGSR